MKLKSLLIPALVFSQVVVHAELITGITVVDGTANPWNPENMGPAKAINGAGLPSNTPALSGTHATTFNTHWWTYPINEIPAQLTLDLDGRYQINTIQIWNYNEGGVTMRSTRNVAIWVSPDDNPENLVKLVTNGTGLHDNETGDFLLPQAPGQTSYTGFNLDLSGITNLPLLTKVRLVRIKPIDSYDVAAGVGLAEIQFDGVPAPEEPSRFQLIITPNGSNYDFRWESKNGKLYDLVTSTDLATPVSQWPVYGGHQNIAGTAPTNTLANVSPDGTRRFFAMIEKDAPPIFSADFEADNGGFSLIGSPNDWAWGAPNSNVQGTPPLVLTSGNGNSTKCWATNLGDGGTPSGFINTGADSVLRSPSINLASITGAQLTFAAAIDATESDAFVVRVRDAGTGELLATINPITLPETETWRSYGPFDLTAADNRNIYLEFRFQGTDGAYIGVYLDDVKVTVK
jgi:hypothetical protein